MKKIFKLIIGIYCIQGFSQDLDNKSFSYHGFSITPIEVIWGESEGGFGIRSDVSFVANKHILLFDVMLGEEYVIWGDGVTYFQINAKYGREFELNHWLYLDAFAGLGYFSIAGSGTVNLPVQLKLRFKTGDRFSLGFNMQSHFNFERTMYSSGILLQWHSKQ